MARSTAPQASFAEDFLKVLTIRSPPCGDDFRLCKQASYFLGCKGVKQDLGTAQNVRCCKTGEDSHPCSSASARLG